MLTRGSRRAASLLRGQIATGAPQIAAAAQPAQRALADAVHCSQDDDSHSSRITGAVPPLFGGAHLAGRRCFSASAVSREDDGQAAVQAGLDAGPSLPDITGGFAGADAITSAAEQAALAAAMGDAWLPNQGIQLLIRSIHSATGTPWWGSIAIATVAMRAATLPLTLKQLRNTFNMRKAMPELKQHQEWYQEQQAAGRGKDAQPEFSARIARTWAKYDCNPFKSMLPLFASFPVFIGFFSALRSLAAAKVPSLMVGGVGFAWYQDLTVADPYYTLPILSSLIFLVSVELNAADGMQGQDETTLSRTKNLMRFLAVAMVPLTASMPQSVFCYWITSNLYSLVQSSVLKLPAVRALLRLPAVDVPVGAAAAAGGQAGGGAAQVGKPVKFFATPPRQRAKGQASSGTQQ